MRNIGPVSAAWLAEVGVVTLGDLDRMGAVETYLRVRNVWPGASLNLLYALEGAILDVDWRRLPAAAKRGLRAQVGA